jgi:hypothetical protein
VLPFLYVMVALGIDTLWRVRSALGLAALAVVAGVSLWALQFYFSTYEKSEYRDMTAFLRSRFEPGEAVVLESPRQHLLAKYYLPSSMPIYPVPEVELPAFAPMDAPRIVPQEVDGYLQDLLRRHGGIWVSYSAENEVDPAEVVQSYLAAISYNEDCWLWVGARLCHYLVPETVTPALSTKPGIRFGTDLSLNAVQVATYESSPGNRYLLVALDWSAALHPAVDYKVTLRLQDQNGSVASQTDNFPIGSLLPPTAWNQGDEKTGYMTLAVPAGLAPGDYSLAVGLYDPATLQPMPASDATASPGRLTPLARVRISSDQSLTYLTPH